MLPYLPAVMLSIATVGAGVTIILEGLTTQRRRTRRSDRSFRLDTLSLMMRSIFIYCRPLSHNSTVAVYDMISVIMLTWPLG